MELIQSFETSLPDDYDFSLVYYEEDLDNPDQDEQMQQRLMQELHLVKKYADHFEELMNQLAIPLRLSIMVLISNRVVSILDPSINYFII